MKQARLGLVFLPLLLSISLGAERGGGAAATGVPQPLLASLAGVVIDDQEPGKPVRRSIVSVYGAHPDISRSTLTDDLGHFSISRLPAGRYTLTVARASYITSAYGAKRPGRMGTAVVLGEGEQRTGLVLTLWRGAVVSGSLRDQLGRPVEGVAVTAVPAAAPRGQALLTLTNNGVATDELGQFRIFGLEPGDYVIRATPTRRPGGPLRAPSESHIDAVLKSLALGERGRTAATEIEQTEPTVEFVPVFYPGTSSLESAEAVRLVTGEQREGIDFWLQPFRTSAIGGRVTRPDGSPGVGTAVQATLILTGRFASTGEPPRRTVTAGADGAFRIQQLSPGTYSLTARERRPANPVSGTAAASLSDRDVLWASAAVTVSGSDVEDTLLALGPGLTLSGNLIVAEAAAEGTIPVDFSKFQVSVVPVWLSTLKPGTPVSALNFRAASPVNIDGTFEIRGLLPDIYRFDVIGPGISTQWFLRSARSGARDLLDGPTPLTEADSREKVTVVLASRPSRVSGTLQAESGVPETGVFVIAFPVIPDHWAPGSRRVQAVRPAADGTFQFNDLPPGDYLLGVLSDIDQGDWEEAALLSELAKSSVKIVVKDGETTVQKLVIRGS